MGRRSRFLGGQCRSRRRLRLHGRWLEPVRRRGWPFVLGAAAVFGTLGSAGFVYWRLMRVKDDSGALFTSVSNAPERRLARLLDGASRRDFIYLVLVLALFGRSNWFLLLAALGAPIYFVLVLFLAARSPAPAKGGAEASTPPKTGTLPNALWTGGHAERRF